MKSNTKVLSLHRIINKESDMHTHNKSCVLVDEKKHWAKKKLLKHLNGIQKLKEKNVIKVVLKQDYY